MISEDCWFKIPLWFLEKHPNIHASQKAGLGDDPSNRISYSFPLSTKGEQKFYGDFATDELFLDIQKILNESKRDDAYGHGISIVLLHECGGITKVQIFKDSIVAAEPTGWNKVEHVEHDYCYGCSKVE